MLQLDGSGFETVAVQQVTQFLIGANYDLYALVDAAGDFLIRVVGQTDFDLGFASDAAVVPPRVRPRTTSEVAGSVKQCPS